MTRKTIKQFGLQRSGTNLTKFLLESNYAVEVEVNRTSWKHGFCDSFHQQTDIVVTTKNVYAWLDSIYRYWIIGNHPEAQRSKKVYGERFAAFLRQPFRFEHANSPDAISHWNLMHRHWLGLEREIAPRRIAVLRYESILENAESACNQVARELDLARNPSAFVRPERKMAVGGERTGVTKRPFDPSFYLERRYLSWFLPDDLRWIGLRVDPEIMKRLDYSIAPNS